ncbi:uncharacterized protein LOC144878985 isoform X1 [Branchiostoma floridae x Branchiostoma japonicum]
MPRRKSKKVMTRLNAWKAEQENKKTADEQGIAGQEKAEEQQVEGLADENECEVTGEWQGEEFMFNPFTANDQLQLAASSSQKIMLEHIADGTQLEKEKPHGPREEPVKPDLSQLQKDMADSSQLCKVLKKLFKFQVKI